MLGLCPTVGQFPIILDKTVFQYVSAMKFQNTKSSPKFIHNIGRYSVRTQTKGMLQENSLPLNPKLDYER